MPVINVDDELIDIGENVRKLLLSIVVVENCRIVRGE